MLGTGACDKWDGALFNQESTNLKNNLLWQRRKKFSRTKPLII